MKQAASLAMKSLNKKWYSIDLERWSDLDIGKGMGSSTADIIATVKAIYSAFNIDTLPTNVLIKIATTIESSDGSMIDGMVAFNHTNGTIYNDFDFYPKFNIVIIIPESTYNTESISFQGKEKHSDQFKDIYDRLLLADKNKDVQEFANCAMLSADLNSEYLPNKYIYKIKKDMLENKLILGYCVGHTGTVCGALFSPDSSGLVAATEYAIELDKYIINSNIEIVKVP